MGDPKLFSVNWQDGMLISRQHLIDQEKFFEELARWYAFYGGDHYGLIRKSASGQPALNYNVAVSGNRLRVEIVRCQAITSGGFYIEINDTLGNFVRAETEMREARVPIFVGVDPARRKEMGNPDPGEDLPRLPYQMGYYTVHIGEPPNLPEEQYLQVAVIEVGGDEAVPAEYYFPPCLMVNAEERLARKALDYHNRLESLLSLSSRAFLAVTEAGGLKETSTSLQQAFRETIHFILYHLGATLDEFTVGRNAMHPRQMIVVFRKLFRATSSLLNLRPGLKDYLNEKYFNRELNSDIGRYMAAIDAFLLAEYDHRDLGGHLKAVDEMLDILKGLLGFLAQTRPEQLGEQAVATDTLTYGGRTYNNIAYGTSRLEQVGELSYLMIDVAEPQPVADIVTLITKDLFEDAEWRRMQVRLGLNESRGLGETDPVEVDTTTFGNKVALHPRDMLKSSSVRQVTLIFRGAADPQKFGTLGKMDLIFYVL